MILGVDHLCRASRDTGADVARFEALGYRTAFAERGMPVHAAKSLFLRRPSTAHDAVFMTSPGRLSVELVRHEGTESGSTPYAYGPASGAVVSVACRSAAASAEFWAAGLGFRAAGAPGELEFFSPVPAWRASVRLDDAPGTPDSYLDDEGWTCLSLIVKDVDEVRRRLASLTPGPVGEVYPLSFHGRSLSLCFLRGPSGEIVELFEVKK